MSRSRAGADHLERDGAIEAPLSRQEDNSHAAAGNFADDLVVAEIAGSPLPQLASESFQLGQERRPPVVGNLFQVITQLRLRSRLPVGLEASANHVNLPEQIDVELG